MAGAAATEFSPIELPQLEIKRVEVTVIGDTTLIMHKWSDKAKGMMQAKQQKKASQGREAKNPEQEFKDSIYRLEDGSPGFPAIGFKAAAVTACTSVAGITKVAARQAFHINRELVPILGSQPTMREDPVRVGMGTADLRYRAEFKLWYAVLEIDYNTRALSVEQIMNLLNTAGFGVGVGEWRPERDGDHGRFHCASEGEVEALLEKMRGAEGGVAMAKPRKKKA